jgi:hypothetical protein
MTMVIRHIERNFPFNEYRKKAQFVRIIIVLMDQRILAETFVLTHLLVGGGGGVAAKACIEHGQYILEIRKNTTYMLLI